MLAFKALFFKYKNSLENKLNFEEQNYLLIWNLYSFNKVGPFSFFAKLQIYQDLTVYQKIEGSKEALFFVVVCLGITSCQCICPKGSPQKKKCLSFGHCPKRGVVQPKSKSLEVVLFTPI